MGSKIKSKRKPGRPKKAKPDANTPPLAVLNNIPTPMSYGDEDTTPKTRKRKPRVPKISTEHVSMTYQTEIPKIEEFPKVEEINPEEPEAIAPAPVHLIEAVQKSTKKKEKKSLWNSFKSMFIPK